MNIDKEKQKAKNNDLSAQLRLARAYEKGDKQVSQNLGSAFYYYRLAADQGDSSAQMWVAEAFERGELVHQQMSAAIAYYQRAADQGNALAQNKLGEMYERGLQVRKDYKQAVAWYRKAADQGHADAQFNLGWMYANGQGVPQDDQQAVAWYRKAADQGHADAQFNLGCMYDAGRGVPQDDKQAMAWYRKAADQGNALAQNKLGEMYERGLQVRKDYKQAVATDIKKSNSTNPPNNQGSDQVDSGEVRGPNSAQSSSDALSGLFWLVLVCLVLSVPFFAFWASKSEDVDTPVTTNAPEELAIASAALDEGVASEALAVASEVASAASEAASEVVEVADAEEGPPIHLPDRLISWGEYRGSLQYQSASVEKKQQIYDDFVQVVLPHNARLEGRLYSEVLAEFSALVPRPIGVLVTWSEYKEKSGYEKASLSERHAIYQRFVVDVLPQNARVAQKPLEEVQAAFADAVPLTSLTVDLPLSTRAPTQPIDAPRPKPAIQKNSKAVPEGVVTWEEFKIHVLYDTLNLEQKQRSYDYYVAKVIPKNAVAMSTSRSSAAEAFRKAVPRP